MIAIIAKLAVVAALGTAVFYALYAMSHLNQRSASGWTPAQVDGAMNAASRGRSSSLDLLQRRAAENTTCASILGQMLRIVTSPRAQPSGARSCPMRTAHTPSFLPQHRVARIPRPWTRRRRGP